MSNIRLAYYTDTMTDLELSDMLKKEELKFLWDDSLLTRLSNSIKDTYSAKNIKACIKREDFRRQMELFLYSKEMSDSMREFPICLKKFPIRYMKLTAIEAGDKKGFEEVLDDNETLKKQAIDFWNRVFAGVANNKLPAIAKALLWGLFSGTIISLLQWEKTFLKLEKSIVTEKVSLSIKAYIGINYKDWNIFLKSFFANLFSDCKNRFLDVQRDKEFHAEWEKQQIEDKIKRFLDTLKRLESGEFLKKWTLFENTQNIWQFELEYFDEKDESKDKNKHLTMIQEWEDLWEHYLAVAHLMPECRFDWKYASSGGKNQSNLYVNLFNIVNKCRGEEINQLWVFLDEPDNTFHPDWERKIIQNLLEICSNFDINFQMLISTHSPIMLSDVPKQAAILLKTVEQKENDDTIRQKEQIYPESNSFGQQIYTLFNDAFFMEQGIIGAFADMKIGEVYEELLKIEKRLSERKNVQEKKALEGYEGDLKKQKCIIKLIDEP